MTSKASAVVFAYHDIGVRCLASLLEIGMDVRLVVSHQDSESEQIWFGSVAELARRHGIEVITPEDPNTPEIINKVADCQPEFIFSFYYRQMLSNSLLKIPTRGAYNVHGSLLPKYRGRVPVNWAIIHGETESGVSLHKMVEKPDAGDLVAQQAVPILSNDTAFDVFQKLKCAAESMLLNVVPELIAGRARSEPMDLAQGSYFGGRKPADGLIDWSRPATAVHNLVRAVAAPFPGAFFDAGECRLQVFLSHYTAEAARYDHACMYFEDGQCYADCEDGKRLMIVHLAIDGQTIDEDLFKARFGQRLDLQGTKE